MSSNKGYNITSSGMNSQKSALEKKSHSVVSAIAGRSWNMETPDVRQKYEMLAHMERLGHAEAHPDYRFSPIKRKRSPVRKEASADSKVPSTPIGEDLEPLFEDTESTLHATEGSWWLHGEGLRYSALQNFKMGYSSNLFGLPDTYNGLWFSDRLSVPWADWTVGC
ncbi:hypothetical protein N7499_003744 [Penicillium canescens]|uniref:uncharacterized protein n=1 Tax=Penicillium canescens TaxID=5083 RepID=UPI0026E0B24E|nr:uncharacterized protein N7446_014086 [Penicillium canescens]KAJ6039338.1 hypothetical protein N7446_014086 [Penicillium canescens]KAJ6066178.1 hypothetical protein N7444_000307 [Penicillium canescens]KAJ6091030.1 hypothetical protein N7499_003744 [Penicillium canescens]KAJ6175257.1 hypothetical protein N7485_005062 [Penicillium canescens]